MTSGNVVPKKKGFWQQDWEKSWLGKGLKFTFGPQNLIPQAGRQLSQTQNWLTPRTLGIASQFPPEVQAAYNIPSYQTKPAGVMQSYIQAQKALPTKTPAQAGGLTPLKPMSYAEAKAMATQLGQGYYIDYDEDIGGYRVERDPRYFEPAPVARPPTEASEFEKGKFSWEQAQAEKQFQAEQARQAQEMNILQQREAREAEQEKRQTRLAELEEQKFQKQLDLEMQKLQWQREAQQMELEQDKQRELARLAAQPRSWLEYAALKGETPVVQPWMLPLSYQQYGWQPGQQIASTQPGYRDLPELMNPSAQYLARMSPSQIQQLYGYEQARTGMPPEDVAWRYGQTTAPSGGGGGLRWLR